MGDPPVGQLRNNQMFMAPFLTTETHAFAFTEGPLPSPVLPADDDNEPVDYSNSNSNSNDEDTHMEVDPRGTPGPQVGPSSGLELHHCNVMPTPTTLDSTGYHAL